MADLEPWQVILIGCVLCNICTSCCCLLLSAGGGAAVSTNPALQAGILVTAQAPKPAPAQAPVPAPPAPQTAPIQRYDSKPSPAPQTLQGFRWSDS